MACVEKTIISNAVVDDGPVREGDGGPGAGHVQDEDVRVQTDCDSEGQHPAGGAGGPTSTDVSHVEDKALRSGCDDALCISDSLALASASIAAAAAAPPPRPRAAHAAAAAAAHAAAALCRAAAAR